MTAPSFSKRPFSKWLAASLLIAVCAGESLAQESGMILDQSVYVDNTDHDLQFFSPVNFDFENQPIGQPNGYFFNFDKLSWAQTGERTVVGHEGVANSGYEVSLDGSTNPWRIFQSGVALQGVIPGAPTPVLGTIITIPAPLFPTGIQSSAPSAQFAWGERYELGYFNGVQGISVGILDGPEVHQSEFYGYGLAGQEGTIVDDDLGIPSPFPGAPPLGISPLGSVLVAFEVPLLSTLPPGGIPGAPTDLGDTLTIMHGYLDVLDATFQGPPGRILGFDSNGDGVLDGDGFADDIDQDGLHGPDGYDLETPYDQPDTKFTSPNPPDYDDLVQLPTSFQTLAVRNQTNTEGIEIMHTYKLSNRHRMAKNQNNDVEFAYGVRYLKLSDEFNVNGFGGVLGTSFWDTSIINNLVGPQIALKWMHQQNRIRWDWSGRCMFAYNIQNWEQTAAIGEGLIPGQLNKPLYLQPTWSKHGKQVNDFSPAVEMRVQASYQITRALAARLGYTATFIDNINRASQHVRYRLPEMGFRDGETQEILINGVNFGFEAVY